MSIDFGGTNKLADDSAALRCAACTGSHRRHICGKGNNAWDRKISECIRPNVQKHKKNAPPLLAPVSRSSNVPEVSTSCNAAGGVSQSTDGIAGPLAAMGQEGARNEMMAASAGPQPSIGAVKATEVAASRKCEQLGKKLIDLAQGNTDNGAKAAELVEAGANLNTLDGHRDTALIYAAQKGHASIARTLIEAKTELNCENKMKSTALMVAAYHGHDSIVRDLIEADADVNHKNQDGETAVMWAAEKGHTNVIKKLIGAKAELNHKDKFGDTALLIAANNGHDCITELLGIADADVNLKNDEATINSSAYELQESASESVQLKGSVRVGGQNRARVQALRASLSSSSSSNVTSIATNDNCDNQHVIASTARVNEGVASSSDVASSSTNLPVDFETFLGRRVLKGVFTGKVVSAEEGLFKVEYEERDVEELKLGELEALFSQPSTSPALLPPREDLEEGQVIKGSGDKLRFDLSAVVTCGLRGCGRHFEDEPSLRKHQKERHALWWWREAVDAHINSGVCGPVPLCVFKYKCFPSKRTWGKNKIRGFKKRRSSSSPLLLESLAAVSDNHDNQRAGNNIASANGGYASKRQGEATTMMNLTATCASKNEKRDPFKATSPSTSSYVECELFGSANTRRNLRLPQTEDTGQQPQQPQQQCIITTAATSSSCSSSSSSSSSSFSSPPSSLAGTGRERGASQMVVASAGPQLSIEKLTANSSTRRLQESASACTQVEGSGGVGLKRTRAQCLQSTPSSFSPSNSTTPHSQKQQQQQQQQKSGAAGGSKWSEVEVWCLAAGVHKYQDVGGQKQQACSEETTKTTAMAKDNKFACMLIDDHFKPIRHRSAFDCKEKWNYLNGRPCSGAAMAHPPLTATQIEALANKYEQWCQEQTATTAAIGAAAAADVAAAGRCLNNISSSSSPSTSLSSTSSVSSSCWKKKRPNKIATDPDPEPAELYRGVYRDYGNWRVKLKHHGKNAHVGCFADPLEAAHAFDAYVRRHSLDKAVNFPTPPPLHGNDGDRDGDDCDDQDFSSDPDNVTWRTPSTKLQCSKKQTKSTHSIATDSGDSSSTSSTRGCHRRSSSAIVVCSQNTKNQRLQSSTFSSLANANTSPASSSSSSSSSSLSSTKYATADVPQSPSSSSHFQAGFIELSPCHNPERPDTAPLPESPVPLPVEESPPLQPSTLNGHSSLPPLSGKKGLLRLLVDIEERLFESTQQGDVYDRLDRLEGYLRGVPGNYQERAEHLAEKIGILLRHTLS